MPEGPEIRRAANQIAKVLVGEEIVDVYFASPQLSQYAEQLTGRVVTSVDTRGKAMLTRFDNRLTLYSHNQLYGVWYTTPRDKPPKTRRSLRVALYTSTNGALLYSASDIDVLTDAELAEHPFLCRIGPDVLDQEIKSARVLARLHEARFRRRALGSLFLDQSFMAGVGNYLRSEILFTARVHPRDRAESLHRTTRGRLARATLRVSRRAYSSRGVTLPQGLAKSLRDRGIPYQKRRFWVFRRASLPCYICATPIEKLQVSSRGLFFCPTCQVQSERR